MLSRVFRGVVLTALVALASAGCLPEYNQIQGERVLYESSEGLIPCAGNVHYLDRLVPFLERQLAVQAPALVRFSWIAGDDDWKPIGGPAYGQLTLGGHAWSTQPANVHELAHAVTGVMPATFFTEGVASAVEGIGDGLAPRYPFSDSELAEPFRDPRATMTATVAGDVNYGTAGSFVTYLLVRHGPEPFNEFYRGLGGPVTMSWLRGQFRQAYGLELDDEIAEFRGGIPACGEDVDPLPLPECSTPGVAWGSEGLWEHELSMACDGPGVVGGLGLPRAKPSFYAVTLEVPEAGYYVLSYNSYDNLEVTTRFGPCFGCPWEPKDVFLERETSQRTMVLDAGTYYLRVNSMSDESPDVKVRLEQL